MKHTLKINDPTPRPRWVYDKFLKREQIRVMTDAEFANLITGVADLLALGLGTFDVLFLGRKVTPEYGRGKWRTGK